MNTRAVASLLTDSCLTRSSDEREEEEYEKEEVGEDGEIILVSGDKVSGPWKKSGAPPPPAPSMGESSAVMSCEVTADILVPGWLILYILHYFAYIFKYILFPQTSCYHSGICFCLFFVSCCVIMTRCPFVNRWGQKTKRPWVFMTTRCGKKKKKAIMKDILLVSKVFYIFDTWTD